MLYLHTSNRLEQLATTLAEYFKHYPLDDPFARETLLVPNKSIEKWLATQLADEIGIWANGRFLTNLPDFWQLLSNLLDTSQFEREVMSWALMEILPTFLHHPDFDTLTHYLQNDPFKLKLFQLSRQIANTFDRYVIYRSDVIKRWENYQENTHNEDEKWQANVWRGLIQYYRTTNHRGKLPEIVFEKLEKNPESLHLPKRLTIFGFSSFPPFYLEIFVALSQTIDVHLFLLDPCQEYWGDIVSDRELTQKTRNRKLEEPAVLHYQTGNSLLASMGRIGRDLIDALESFFERTPYIPREYFVENSTQTLLTTIQDDILQLDERTSPKYQIAATDKSLQIHVCHSPMREVEVLYDQVLALFEAEPQLQPKDIVVLTPDIETYVPFIHAVFATVTQENNSIPFTIADRSMRYESELVSTFLAILSLEDSRFTITDVFNILESEIIQSRFDLVNTDLEKIKHWVSQVNIRWGIDKHNRKQQQLPDYEENTWWFGLKRLLLGYAMSSSEEKLFHDILPFYGIEGSETLILGNFIEFITQLFETITALKEPRTLTQWVEFLLNLLDKFLGSSEENKAQIHQLQHDIFDPLITNGHHAQFTAKVSHHVIFAYLKHHIEATSLSPYSLTGKVTFCAIQSMPAIPFKVICLLGMNDHAFPRVQQTLSFDLIAQQPRRGDHSLRLEDRYLFLQTLLAAREYLYISYIGQSIRDNTVLPPSVLVSELLDYVVKGFKHEMYDSILEAIQIFHPLQPFSPRYFDGSSPNLFSYSESYCRAGYCLTAERENPIPLFSEPLPPPDSAWQTIPIEQLVKFFTHPVKFLLQERLGIYLQMQQVLPLETEPFALDNLEKYSFNQILVEKALKNQDLSNYHAIAKATGELPHGVVGEYIYAQQFEKTQQFIDKVKPYLDQEKVTSPSVNLTIGKWQLIGHLPNTWANGLTFYRHANLKTKDYLKSWIYHVILNNLDITLPKQSVLIGQDKIVHYKTVENSQHVLHQLVNIYWQGLSEPLPFFPESSLSFIQTWFKGKTEEEAIIQAKKIWFGSDYFTGESEDDYYTLGLKHIEASLFDDTFITLAHTIFEPLLVHQQAV